MGVEELAEELNQRQDDKVIFLGDGVEVYRTRLEEKLTIPHQWAPAHLSKQRAGAVAWLGGILYEEGKAVPAAEHEPIYLRLAQAERERMEKGL